MRHVVLCHSFPGVVFVAEIGLHPVFGDAVSCVLPKYQSVGYDGIVEDALLSPGRTIIKPIECDDSIWHDVAWSRGSASPATSDYCGTYVMGDTCPRPEHQAEAFRPHSMHCHRLDCSVCGPANAARGALSATGRFWGLYQDARRHDPAVWGACHLQLSAPPEMWPLFETHEGYLAVRKWAVSHLKEAGAIGGCLVYHRWRQNKVSKEWRYGPHWHVVTYGFLEDSDEFHARTGWLYKKIERKRGSKRWGKYVLMNERAVYAVIRYALGHCAIGRHGERGERTLHSVTWFGTMANNKAISWEDPPEQRMVECGIDGCTEKRVTVETNRVPLRARDCVLPGFERVLADEMTITGIYSYSHKTKHYRLRDPPPRVKGPAGGILIHLNSKNHSHLIIQKTGELIE